MKSIRIANAGGYWGDDPFALRRQVMGDLPLNYISIDFLAEVTMSILQKQRQRDEKAGFAKDFLTQIKPLLPEILKRKIRIITNAGGVNPRGCAQALGNLAAELGLNLKIAVVDGDNIVQVLPNLLKSGVAFDNMDTGEKLDAYSDKVLAANAYFGAMPVVEALKFEPDIILCGRVTDTGITLAAMMHEFSWKADDYDKLAHGIVAGHIIECGAQATGGNFTDWRKVKSFIDVGYPIVECFEDGSFIVTKHPHTGGLVSAQTVREQLLYEMGHPQSYIVPDVIADFTTIALDEIGPDKVKVSGVKGRKPTDFLKISIAYADGFKSQGTLIISGPDAKEKAQTFAAIFWERLKSELALIGLSPCEATQTEYIGSDSTHGKLAPAHTAPEILLRLAARDHDDAKLHVFRKLLPSLILSGPSGVAVTGGAPAISDVVSYWPALIPQKHALPTVAVYSQTGKKMELQNEVQNLAWPETGGTADVREKTNTAATQKSLAPFANDKKIEVPLMKIAHARSGDKGDTANIGLIARSYECYAWMAQNISAELVKKWFTGICHGRVLRFEVENLWALNFLLEETLGGGGTMSLHIDAQGKTLSQALLRCRVAVPEGLLKTISPQLQACAGELA